MCLFFSVLRFSLGKHGNDAAVQASALEVDNTVGQGEERVVLTHAYVFARVVYCAALTNDDVASNANLTTPNLNTQSLRS